MNDLALHYHPFSNCSQRVLLLLEELGIPYQKHVINLIKSQQLAPEYLEINPKGRVPALTYQGRHYSESCDILRFIDQQFAAGKLTPSDPVQLTAMNNLLDDVANSHDVIKDFVYSQGIGRLPNDAEYDLYQQIDPENFTFHQQRRQGLIGCDKSAGLARIRRQFERLEHQLSSNHWLAGELSLADFAWYPNTIIYRQLGYGLEDFPKVADWIKRFEARDCYQQGLKPTLDKVPNWLIKPIMIIKRWLQPSRY